MQVEIIDETHQRFNGVNYRRNKRGWFQSPYETLHRAVWKFHNGEIPKGYDIHHVDFDKANNDISNLQMLTRKEHKQIHAARLNHEFVCEMCGETFSTSAVRAKYCPSCRKKSKPSKQKPKPVDEFAKRMKVAARRIQTISNRLRTCEHCGKLYILPSNSHRKTCSDACAKVAHDQRCSRSKICEVCGKPFQLKHKHKCYRGMPSS